MVVESRRTVGVPWQGPAMVDGRLWSVYNGTTLWLPHGSPHDRIGREGARHATA